MVGNGGLSCVPLTIIRLNKIGRKRREPLRRKIFFQIKD